MILRPVAARSVTACSGLIFVYDLQRRVAAPVFLPYQDIHPTAAPVTTLSYGRSTVICVSLVYKLPRILRLQAPDFRRCASQSAALVVYGFPSVFSLQATDFRPAHHEVADGLAQGQHPGLHRAHVRHRRSGVRVTQGDLAGGSRVDPGAGHRGLGRKGVNDRDEGLAHRMGGAVKVGADRCEGGGKVQLDSGHAHGPVSVGAGAREQVHVQLLLVELLVADVAAEGFLHRRGDQHVVKVADRALASLLLADVDGPLEDHGLDALHDVADLQLEQVGDPQAGAEPEGQQAGFPVAVAALEPVDHGTELVVALKGDDGHVTAVGFGELLLAGRQVIIGRSGLIEIGRGSAAVHR